MRIGFRPRLAPTLFAVPIVLICLGLSAWQVQRLYWKRDLIAQRDAAVSAPPVALPRTAGEAPLMEFRHVAVDGVFLHDKEIFLGASSGAGQVGYQILTPLREADGRFVFVNRGFIPSELKDPTKRVAGQSAGSVHILGLLRVPPTEKPNWFLPDNRPDRNYWFWVDLPAIAAADGLTNVAPFIVDADATPNPGGWPKGGVTRLDLPNDHLQYAITWFALAVAMVVVYVVYHRQSDNRGPQS
jgi:surfeit locus 1 family protein